MKRKKIIETGKELFWKHGIKKISVEEICKEANVSKMTFYKFFPNKIEFAQYILDNVIEESLVKFQEIVDSDISFTEKVKQLFVMKLEAAGDISKEFIEDMYKNPDSGLLAYMEKQGERSMKIFKQFIEDSKKKGLIRKDVKVEFILAYQKQLTLMMEDKELMNNYDHIHELIMESMEFLFYGIVERDVKK